jgi:Ran GTPase-activating protein (RanGAP) involved in mRNA processing and transport
MKLPQCYVLIEPFDVPSGKHFKDVGDSLSETLAVLDLNEEDDVTSDEDDDLNEESDGESHIEESLVPKKGKNVIIKDKAMNKSLSEILRTKII